MTNPEIFKAISNGAVVRDVEDKLVSNNWFSDLLDDVGHWEICYNYTDSDDDVWIPIK